MQFDELIIKRRSIRNYIDKPISQDIILKIIEDSTFAPSSSNEQPWKYIIVQNKALIKEISDKAKATLLDRILQNPSDYAGKYKKMLANSKYNIFYNAPCVVFIVGDKNLKNTKTNCSLAACYFMMSATAHGLGTCWINFATAIQSTDLMQKLGISQSYEIVAPITIGYPVHIPDVPNKNNPDILNIID